MSPKAQAWALPIRGIKGSPKAVLMYLANRYNEKEGYAWPSISRIAKDTCFSVSTVNRALRSLEQAGLIAIRKQKLSEDGSEFSNRYYLVGHSRKVPTEGFIFFKLGNFGPWGNWEKPGDEYFDYLSTDLSRAENHLPSQNQIDYEYVQNEW